MASVMERLRELGRMAAETAAQAQEYEDEHWRKGMIETGLYLARRKLFPEVKEPSPFGRIQYLPGGKARIIRPKQ